MKTTLLRRFRWPLFIIMMAGGLTAGIFYHFNRPEVTVYGIVACLFAACAAVVLNTIDEQTQNFEDGDARNI